MGPVGGGCGLPVSLPGLVPGPLQRPDPKPAPSLPRELPSRGRSPVCRSRILRGVGASRRSPTPGPALSARSLASAPWARACPVRCAEPSVPTSVPEEAARGGLGARAVFPLPGSLGLLPGTLLPAGCKGSGVSLCGSYQPRAISHCPVVTALTVCRWVCSTACPSASPTPGRRRPSCLPHPTPRRVCCAQPGRCWFGVGCPSGAGAGTRAARSFSAASLPLL